MALKVIKTTDPMPVENINILLYGIPGIGKTSIACSALNAFLLDFDHGAHRSGFRCETGEISEWSDVASLSPEFLKPYDTIILDTVGRALDMLTLKIQRDNPKFRTANGNLTLQGWGELKGAFTTWMRQLRLMGKDVIMLAHDKEKERDELTVVRADIQGGSYAEIMKMSDSVAWFGAGGEHNRGVLDFNPTPEHSGKNPGHLDPINVPNLHQEPKFMAGVITQIKKRLGEIGERGLAIGEAVDEYRDRIDEAKTMKAINELADESQKIEDRAVMSQVKHLIAKRATALGLVYSKEKTAFIKDPSAKSEKKEDAA